MAERKTKRSIIALAVLGAMIALLGTTPADGQDSGEASPARPIPIQAVDDDGGATEAATSGGGGVSLANPGTGVESGGTPAPAIPEGTTSPGGAESVIGADGRLQITDTMQYPSRAIGQLNFQQNGGFICTGWLIDPNTILMSGHCVHSGGLGGVPTTTMTFAPGRNGGTNPYGTCAVTQLYTTSQWLNSANAHHDWGLGQLNCDIGDTVGWFGYRSLSTNALVNRSIDVRGYPGDKPSGTMWTMADWIRFLSGGNRSVHYRSDTFGGQSGSPVFEASGCNGPCGLAIHSYGCPGGAPCPPPNDHNSGPRITSGRFQTIYGLGAMNDDHPDALVRRYTGSFLGNDIINLNGAGQSLSDIRVPRGATRRYIVQVQKQRQHHPELPGLGVNLVEPLPGPLVPGSNQHHQPRAVGELHHPEPGSWRPGEPPPRGQGAEHDAARVSGRGQHPRHGGQLAQLRRRGQEHGPPELTGQNGVRPAPPRRACA